MSRVSEASASHVLRCYRYDQRTFWRLPQAAFFTFALPVFMLVILSAMNGGDIDALGEAYSRYLLIGMVSFTLATSVYGSLAVRLTYRRETGIYQRLRTTPVPASALVVGQIASAITVAAITLTVLMSIAAVFFDAALPTNWPLFLAVVAVGSATCCALGAAVSTMVRRVEAADPIVFATMLPIAFISGTFQYVPPDSVLARLAELFPVRHVVLATMDAFGIPGTGSLPVHFAVILAWGAVGAVVAVRRFRWAPTR